MYRSFSKHLTISKAFPCQQYEDDHYSSASDLEDPPPSPTSSESSVDEDEINRRMKPFWPKYRTLFKLRGIRLDTVGDVKLFYKHRLEQPTQECTTKHWLDDLNSLQDDDALCPDAGLVSAITSSIQLDRYEILI